MQTRHTRKGVWQSAIHNIALHHKRHYSWISTTDSPRHRACASLADTAVSVTVASHDSMSIVVPCVGLRACMHPMPWEDFDLDR